MTIPSVSIHRNIWFILLAACLILGGGLFILHHVPACKKDIVSTAFLGDIVITFPVAYYLLLMRPLRLKKRNLFLVTSCCLAVAYFILPAHQQGYIAQIKKLTMFAELGVLIYAISKIKRISAVYKQLKVAEPYNPYLLRKSMVEVLGDSIGIKLMASEIGMLKFGLLPFGKKEAIPPAATGYSIHKDAGYIALFSIFMFACFGELIGFHLLIAHYSKIAAVIISILTAYGIVIITGDLAAIIKKPVLVMPDRLILRTGIRWVANVERNNILSVEKIRIGFEPDKDTFNGGILKSSINICFTLAQPVSVERVYSKAVSVTKIVMTIDDADKLIAELS
ncbi:hypothetical protein IDJ75_05550 [Mucilaginibacter rigui]|uniref:Uncharacterized protein n=1 Tax=Mucilaginibacter rigui TaxID=534635 RepID=A0ABR7X538_9SPHI|nr:hypothetical protein [Mucilaginibacter rigui]MBD1384735.1 hypothetical protein [Mucilaginibacter rigui]